MNQLYKILKQYFGYDNFREGQEEVIKSILSCQDTLAVMPTGAGKSLCYQIPSLIMHGTVIVVSPLIALMKDQVDTLIKNGIPATSIDSTLSQKELYDRLKLISTGRIKLLYIAPERIESKLFLDLLKYIEVPFIAVDEAHCISEWGHDFRPSYLNVTKIFDVIERCPILALTATATSDVRNDIEQLLKLNDPKSVITGFERKNLRYYSENVKDKVLRISDILSETKDGSTIIYAGSRKKTEKLANDLKEYKIKAEPYHAGMRTLLRTAVQDRFLNGTTKVIVATSAFGMGIDKEDVRNVIHVDYPLTIEAYYQEAGRAGRDGKPANCYILVSDKDRNLPEFFVRSTYPSKFDVKLILDTINHFLSNNNQSENVNIIPEPIVIANEIGKDYRTVESVYNLMLRYAIINKGNVYSRTSIKITTSRERIYEYHQNLPEDKKFVLESLLRSVSSDVFNRFVNLNSSDLARKHTITINQVNDLLRSLKLLNMVHIISEESESGYYFNHHLKNIDINTIDFEENSKRYSYSLLKLNTMYDYVNTAECKRNFILDYFNDYSYSEECGKCSSCKTNQIKTQRITSEYSLIHSIILLNLINLYDGIELSKIYKIIIDNIKLYDKNKDSSMNFYKFKELINDEIKILNYRRLIKFNNINNRTIAITNEGIEFVRNLPEHYKNMAKRVKDKTESEIIFGKLATLRREIAEHAGVVPRGIISDVALRKITEELPETEYDLKNISGVSQLFVQKFAKLFLQELSKIRLNPKEQKVSKVAQDFLKMLDQGLEFDVIKSRLFAGNMSIASNYIVEIIEAGHDLPRQSIVADDVYKKVKSCVKKHPDLNSRELQEKLSIELDPSVLRIACSFAKSELGVL